VSVPLESVFQLWTLGYLRPATSHPGLDRKLTEKNAVLLQLRYVLLGNRALKTKGEFGIRPSYVSSSLDTFFLSWSSIYPRIGIATLVEQSD
jgi:hypothetical protein